MSAATMKRVARCFIHGTSWDLGVGRDRRRVMNMRLLMRKSVKKRIWAKRPTRMMFLPFLASLAVPLASSAPPVVLLVGFEVDIR